MLEFCEQQKYNFLDSLVQKCEKILTATFSNKPINDSMESMPDLFSTIDDLKSNRGTFDYSPHSVSDGYHYCRILLDMYTLNK